MRIGIISDTHGDAYAARMAARVFEAMKIDLLIHCGDVGSANLIEMFSQWESHFVVGNTDSETVLAEDVIGLGQNFHERFGQLDIEGTTIAFMHGDDERLLEETIASGRWDLVCHGHTHSATEYRRGDTLVLNPGAIHRAANPSVAVVDLPSLNVTTIAL